LLLSDECNHHSVPTLPICSLPPFMVLVDVDRLKKSFSLSMSPSLNEIAAIPFVDIRGIDLRMKQDFRLKGMWITCILITLSKLHDLEPVNVLLGGAISAGTWATYPEIKIEKKNHAHTHSFIHKKQVGYSLSLVRLWQDQTTTLEGSKNRKSSAKSKARNRLPKSVRRIAVVGPVVRRKMVQSFCPTSRQTVTEKWVN
nr:hypothetical protein [Tanacetum cinerariifolium]